MGFFESDAESSEGCSAVASYRTPRDAEGMTKALRLFAFDQLGLTPSNAGLAGGLTSFEVELPVEGVVVVAAIPLDVWNRAEAGIETAVAEAAEADAEARLRAMV